jgi:hypothetical protein
MNRTERKQQCPQLRWNAGVILFVLLLAVSCARPNPNNSHFLAAKEGVLFLYAAPLRMPQAFAPCAVETVSAVQHNGQHLPLTVQLPHITSQELTRQRRFAAGTLPSGDYSGLSLRFSAPLPHENSPSAELRQQELFIPCPFRIEEGKSALIQLALTAPNSGVATGSLQVTAALPPQPFTALSGSVSSSPCFVTFFDRQTDEVTGVVITGEEPGGMAIDLERQRLYVALAASAAVEVIDTASGRILSRIKLQGGDEPADLALINNGRTLLAVNRASSTLSFIDPLGEFEEERISVAAGPHRIVVAAQEDRAWLFCVDSGLISLIDLPNRMERKTMAIVPGEATGVLGRRDEVLYIAGQANAFLQVLDAATLQTQQLFVVDNGLQTLARDPMTGLLYGAARSEPGIQVYEPQGMNRIATLIAPNEIIDLTLDGTRHRLYAIAPESKTVQIYSLGGRHAVNALEPVGEPKRVLLFGVR